MINSLQTVSTTASAFGLLPLFALIKLAHSYCPVSATSSQRTNNLFGGPFQEVYHKRRREDPPRVWLIFIINAVLPSPRAFLQTIQVLVASVGESGPNKLPLVGCRRRRPSPPPGLSSPSITITSSFLFRVELASPLKVGSGREPRATSKCISREFNRGSRLFSRGCADVSFELSARGDDEGELGGFSRVSFIFSFEPLGWSGGTCEGVPIKGRSATAATGGVAAAPIAKFEQRGCWVVVFVGWVIT